jgi:hypothetical protein
MRVEPKLPAKVPNIDSMINEGLEKIAGEVRDESFAPKKRQSQRSQFAIIGHQAVDAMVKAAEDVVTKAQVELENVKKRAEELRAKFDAQDAELQVLMERVTSFGNAQLDAHRKFTDRQFSSGETTS